LTRFSPYRAFRHHPATAWAALLLLIMLLLRLITGFNGLYGQDSYAYLLQSQAWQDSFRGGPHPPPFFWPEGYPVLGAIAGMAMPVGTALQLISMLSAVATLYFCIRLGRELFPSLRQQGAILFLLVGLSPWGLRSGMLVMSDSLGVALLAAAGWWAWKYWKEGQWAAMAAASLALGLAVSVRYPLALPGLLPVTLLAAGAWKRRDVRAVLFPALIGGVAGGHFLLHDGMQGGLIGHHFLGEWSLQNWFRRDFNMQDGQFHYRMINIFYALGAFWHPGLVGLGVVALPLGVVWKTFARERRLQVMALTAVVYLLFVAGIPFQNPRFLLPVLPLVGLIYLPVPGKAAEKLGRKWMLVAGIAVAITHLTLMGFTSRKLLTSSRLEQEMANWPAPGVNKVVYTFGMDGALKVYRPDLKVVNLWDAPLQDAQAGAWLLFNEEAFREQWQGKNPMVNFDMLREKYDLKELKTYQGGWVWYEIR
jgi:hypothetical protein